MLRRADYLVILFALLLLPYLYITLWGNGSYGEQVVIRSANQPPQYYPLYENRHITIAGALGKSVIEIKDRRVRFIEAPCQNKLCIHSGWLRHDGELAACIPNGVTVSVVGRDNRFDAINF
jgi:hypothetical protein